jgi:hypothetical protein
MNSVSAQTGAFTPFTNAPGIPLTNQLAFTNTLVEATNLSAMELSDVVALLLSLQTNVEETLPVLDLIESNAAAASASTVPLNGPFAHITSNPQSLFSPPTGTGGQQQTSLPVRVGTNIFDIDPATLQAITTLRQNLAQALPALQALNGTSPTLTNGVTSNTTFSPPRNFVPAPLTNGFFTPLTNMSPFLTSGVPSAF